ncbi:MAG: YitT family protein [Chitinophagaceae bacterium]|nr:YitT family protein [Chitinophagaceae bacterium]
MENSVKKKKVLLNEIRKVLGKNEKTSLTSFQLAKGYWILRRRFFNEVKSAILIALGILSAGFGLKGFLIPNGLIDGGAMGISLLTSFKTKIPLSVLIIMINLPFFFIAWHQIGKWFTIKSLIAIILLAIVVESFPYQHITEDKLLIAVFGGFFLGAGIGLCIRGGGVIDGTEVLAIFLSKRNSLSVGDFIMFFNIIIFSVAAYLINIETALYSILIYFSASKTVDFILEGIEEFTGVTIISPHCEEIATFIKEKMGRGLTVYSGKRGSGKRGESHSDSEIIFTVVTRLEINRLTTEVERIDPNAFIVMQSIKDTKGGMVKKRPLKE